MTNDKQSSVEWLFNKIFSPNPKFGELFEQAKEMHKEESFLTFQAGQDSTEEGGKGFEQYYEQTYGGNKWEQMN